MELDTGKPSEGGSETQSLIRDLSNGSLAHSIIGKFLQELEKVDDSGALAVRLAPVVLHARPTEATLKQALFEEAKK